MEPPYPTFPTRQQSPQFRRWRVPEDAPVMAADPPVHPPSPDYVPSLQSHGSYDPQYDASEFPSIESRPVAGVQMGGRPINLPQEWTKHQRQAIDPTERFDMQLRNATIPPAPPPASPEPAYTLDDGGTIGGVEIEGEARSFEDEFSGPDPRDVRYITSRPDVVDVELDGTHTLRPAPSNEYMPLPEHNTTRVLMWQIDFEPDDIDSPSGSERGNDLKHWDSMGPTYTTPVAGKLLYHVDNTDRPVQEFFASSLAKPYDVWDLQRLWDTEVLSEGHRVRPFMVQTNILSEGLNVPFHWYREGRQAMTKSEELRFGNDTITFWESRTVVTSLVDEDTASINIEFDGLPICFEKKPRGIREVIAPLVPSEVAGDSVSDVRRRTGRRDDHGMQTKAFSPLKDHFLRVLVSTTAASSIEHESSEIAIKLIMLDLLRAVIECWAVFAWQLVHEVNEVTDNIDAQSRLHNVRVWQGLQSAPRDIRLATEYLVRSVERDLSPAGRRKLDNIVVEMDARIRSIDNRINDIAACVSDLSSTRTAVTQEEQALSVKRLTLLAAVFLPLSLASSLLSMGTRAIDLGVLWYDYLGTSVLLVFLAYLAYQTLRAWDMGLARWKKMLAKLLVGRLDEEAVRRKPKFKMVRFAFAMVAMTFSQFGLKPTQGWKAYVVCHYALGLTVVASFAVGMFHDLILGLMILGYAAAGWLGALILLTCIRVGIFVWKCCRRVWAEIKLWRKRGNDLEGRSSRYSRSSYGT